MRRKRSVFDGKYLTRFVVTLKSGGVLSGLLQDHTDTEYVFADVRVRLEDRWEKAAGSVYVDRVDVEYLQDASDAPE